MSRVVAEFVETLHTRASGAIRGTARIAITGEGSVMLDETGARPGDGPADVVLLAAADVFRGILDGSVNPVMAYMIGKLKVEGNAMRALKVSELLTR
jgi:putative sterol carrier protein